MQLSEPTTVIFTIPDSICLSFISFFFFSWKILQKVEQKRKSNLKINISQIIDLNDGIDPFQLPNSTTLPLSKLLDPHKSILSVYLPTSLSLTVRNQNTIKHTYYLIMTLQQEVQSWTFPASPQVSPIPSVGDKAPGSEGKLVFPRKDGKGVVLCFLRHCGCPCELIFFLFFLCVGTL